MPDAIGADAVVEGQEPAAAPNTDVLGANAAGAEGTPAAAAADTPAADAADNTPAERPKIALPEAGDADGWNDLYSQLGRPESADGYEITYRDHDEKVNWNDDAKREITKAAHGWGINNKQLQNIVDWYGDILVDSRTQQDAAAASAMQEMRDTYGPVADRKFAQANNLLNRIGGQELLQAVSDSGLGGNPVFVKSIIKLTEQMNEDSTVLTEVSGVTSQTEARERIKEIRNDKESGFNKRDKSAIQEMEKLYKLAYE